MVPGKLKFYEPRVGYPIRGEPWGAGYSRRPRLTLSLSRGSQYSLTMAKRPRGRVHGSVLQAKSRRRYSADVMGA